MFLSHLHEREKPEKMKLPPPPPSPPSPPQPFPFIPLIIISTLLIFVSFADGDDATIMSKLAKGLNPTPPGWSGSTPCKWTGVKCDSSNRVTSISLNAKSLSGQLPSDINQLANLISLSVQRNTLSGPLPSLANLTFLQEVFLDNNDFSSVPSSFLAGLTSLHTFSINENPNLSPWTIPNEITDSSSLVSFMASKANIIGTMPDVFGSFPNLQSLKLSYNNLTGSLPPSLSGSGIQNLWINNQMTGLSGRIDVLGEMSQLSQVWLHANSFSGPVPDLSKCTSLFDLQLRDNQITGIVPPSLSSLPKLVNISLQNNRLQGPVPEFGKGVNVTLGSTNNFCNPKPGPCDPKVTTLLEIAGALGYPMTLAESWKGNDPCEDWSFVTCDAEKGVSIINFGKQHWTGTISPAMANLTSLRSVFLNDNNLTGSIPDSLAKLSQLQVLDVSNNNLSGKIPGFSSKVTVKTAGNPLIGTDVSPGSDGTPGGTSDSGSNSTSSSSLLSNGAIAGIVCTSLVLIGIVAFFVYKCYAKRRYQKPQRGNGKVKNGIMGNMNGYGEMTSEVPSQSSADNEHIHVYDGGNVAIPIEVLREVTNNFSDGNVLGRGGFGIVYKGELHDGTEIAVKRMEANVVSSKGLNEFQAEIGVLTKVRHRHLVALLGFCVNGNERLLVYEYMPRGTLGQHLFECKENGVSPLTWKQRVAIALDVARGIEYLHSLAQQSFIHRDLKPSNILLGDDLRAKVSDFGLVKNAPDGKYSLETRLAGTFGYLAPEYAATGRVTIKVDVFAFGVVLMELMTGRKSLDETLPEDRSNLIVWFKKFMTNKDSIRNLIDPTLVPDEETFESICKVAELAGYCTAREPYQRPDMGHAVNVLAPLVDQWKPTAEDKDDSIGIDLHMSLPQALQRWQEDIDSSTMTSSDFFNSHSHTPRQ